MDAQIPQNTGLIVIAMRKPDGGEAEDYEYVFNPVGSTRVEPGDVMIVLGKPEQVQKLREYVNP
jgi:uncharacterized protein with PhoU and TrkA domain